MTRRAALAILVALLLALALLAWPVAAQPTAPPTATAAPTPTRTGGDLVGVGAQVDSLGELFARYGVLGALGLLLVGGVFYLLTGAGEGVREAIKKRFEGATERTLKGAEAPGANRQRRSVEQEAMRAYLAWLEEECGVLPQKPLDVKDEELRLEQVYVPLRVWERDQMDRFVAYRLREFADAEEAEARERAYSGFEQRQGVYRLLSDRACLPKAANDEQPARKRRASRDDANDAPPPEPLLCRRMLLVGEAGSGKTTTLHFGALMLARDYANSTSHQVSGRLDLHTQEPLLPLYIRLTLLTRWLFEKYRNDRSVLVNRHAELVFEWLRYDLPRQNSAILAELLPARIRTGGCLILFDGLDETGDAAERDFAKGLIANLVQSCPNNRYLVASRPFEGVAHGLPGDFIERHLSPLDGSEIQDLLHKWFDAVRLNSAQKPQRSVDQEYDEIWGRLERSPRLFDMATNPLLLTSMAILVHGGDSLPAQRAKIYKRLVDLTIIRWRVAELNRGLPPDARAVVYLEEGDEVRLRLQLLAAWMLREQRREILLREAQDELGPIYKLNRGWGREQCDIHVRTLMGLLALNSGLVQERDGRYSFIHFTLQEYLAARHYDELGDVAGLLARRGEQRWREAVLLAIGHWCTDGLRERAVTALNTLLAPPSGADALLATLLQGASHADLLLAAEALDEANAHNVAAVGAQRAACVAQLRAIAFDPAACPNPVDRNAAASFLDRFGADERPALDPLRPEFWAERIAPGPFVMGDDNGQYDDEKPAFTHRIVQPYALARFPVTNRLYLRFLESLDEQGLQEHLPRYWPGRRYRADEGNHPVVGVRLHSAAACAAWLDGFLRAEGVLPAGEAVRLPTEPQWERAAAYPPAQATERRVYPWPELTNTTGGSMIGNIPANISESGLRGTSAVGIFPHGAAACGAQDMGGNVWEWCASSPEAYPLAAEEMLKTIYTTGVDNSPYVLRGGSWADGKSYARCAYRLDLNPALDAGNFGFRLARLFSLPSSS